MIARGIRLHQAGGRNAPGTGGDVVARAIKGSLHAPLNTDQKRALAAAARKAYDQHGGSPLHRARVGRGPGRERRSRAEGLGPERLGRCRLEAQCCEQQERPLAKQ